MYRNLRYCPIRRDRRQKIPASSDVEGFAHFQLRPRWAAGMGERDMLAELRARKESGKGAYA
jgi:hypothetical protein